MDAKKFQENALRTESVPAKLVVNERAFDAMFRTVVGLGLVADMFKRQLYYARSIDAGQLTAVATEVATSAKYLARLAAELGTDRLNACIEGEHGAGGDMGLIDMRLLHCALGCFTESGEMFEALQVQYQGGELNKANFGIELGDTNWYQAIGLDALGKTQEEVWEAVIAKLCVRFPEKFDAAQAVTRDLAAEEKAGEGKLKGDAPTAEDVAALKAEMKKADATAATASEIQKRTKSA